jgi:hypothetical protein
VVVAVAGAGVGVELGVVVTDGRAVTVDRAVLGPIGLIAEMLEMPEICIVSPP